MPHLEKPQAIILSIAILALLIGGFVYWRWNPRPGTVPFSKHYSIQLKTYEGKAVTLSPYKHTSTIIHSWASWCVYCGAEVQTLAKMHAKYGNKVHIVAINRAESLFDAKAFSDKLGVDGAVTFLLDPNDVFYKSLGGYAMPETLFIDDRGEIVFYQHGPLGEADLQSHIDSLLK